MKTVVSICAAVTMLLAIGSTALAFSWQTTPILGTDVIDTTGDVVLITGPQPLDGGGNPYYDVDSNPVLGPTIPYYSIVGDPLYLVGSPSMTQFMIDPNTLIGGHMTDTVARIAAGSGINVDIDHNYHWTSVWTYLGSLQPTYAITSEDDYFAPASEGGFVKLEGWIDNLWAEDVGNWTYAETWTDSEGETSITSTTAFTVTVVPEPATLGLLAVGGLALLRRRRR